MPFDQLCRSATFTPVTLSAPGSGSSTLKITATSKAKAGTYSVTVSAASSGSTTQKMPLSVTVVRRGPSAPTLTVEP